MINPANSAQKIAKGTSAWQRGFTLIETMVAVSIVTLAVAGPLFTASRAVLAATNARDQLTASYLAQEGIEYIRSMRDNEFLKYYLAGGSTISTTAWTNFISGSDAASITSCRASTCKLDPGRIMGVGSGLSLETCSGDTCTPLYLANGIYTQQSNIQGSSVTVFKRTIQLVDVPGSTTDERVVSTVSWSFHGVPYTITVYDHLTPWQ
jgi:prepilin-type N-terminal cleavage/methylation domain-containing protein